MINQEGRHLCGKWRYDELPIPVVQCRYAGRQFWAVSMYLIAESRVSRSLDFAWSRSDSVGCGRVVLKLRPSGGLRFPGSPASLWPVHYLLLELTACVSLRRNHSDHIQPPEQIDKRPYRQNLQEPSRFTQAPVLETPFKAVN